MLVNLKKVTTLLKTVLRNLVLLIGVVGNALSVSVFP